MWRLNAVRHKVRRQGDGLEEFKFNRREQEKTLRQARRDRQLVSKRLLVNDDEEDQEESTTDTSARLVTQDQVLELLQKAQAGGVERLAHLRALRKALRIPAAQLAFIRQEQSMRVLVGLLSGADAQGRMEAARCLFELSTSPHPNLGPATPYLLTYLSGQSGRLTELCLYTLGNLCPDSEGVREKLLAQGIVSALATCLQIQRSNLAVVEAVGFTLSQLLQGKDAEERVIPMVLASGLTSDLLSLLTPDPHFGIGPAIECAWCLHYLTCSSVGSKALKSQGAASLCSSLLVSLGGAVAKGDTQEGLELLIWPLLRCLGNLVASGTLEDMQAELSDCRVLAALCLFAQAFLHTHPALARESVWVLNNLTADSAVFCSAFLCLNLAPALLHLLPFSQGINAMALRILGNIAHKGVEYCLQLTQAGLLLSLSATLKMADLEMVTLSLEVLGMLVSSSPLVAEVFVRQKGLPLLEAMQYNSEGEIRDRATYLLERHLSSLRTVDTDS